MRLLYLGDIHGNFNLISQYVKKFDIKDAYIIQVGDFGVGFKTLKKELVELSIINNVLNKRNVVVYAIRGNHDAPHYFDNDPFNLSNIKLVKDYTILNILGKNILCIGGAISIDRKHRYTNAQNVGDFTIKDNDSWWLEEKFILREDILNDMREIDIVITHTAPDYCSPNNGNGFGHFVNRWISIDPDLKNELISERYDMTQAFNILKKNNNITNSYYGHFHSNWDGTIDGIKHKLLNIGELYEEYKKEEL